MTFKGGVYLLGDIHGNMHALSLAIATIPSESLLIQVGDFGMGFPGIESNMRKPCKLLGDIGDKQLYILRGNHDDNSWFQDPDKIDKIHSHNHNVTILRDYDTATINGSRFQFVGGATSIDRGIRNEGLDYFPGEVLEFSPEKMDESTEILITHTAPDFLPHLGKQDSVDWYAKDDPDLIGDLSSERHQMSILIERCPNLRKHYYGHFHQHDITEHNGTIHRCIDIDEVVEIII